MLRFALLLAALPVQALADDIPVNAPVTQATIHPYGATLQRQVSFAVTPGEHRVILSDLPQGTPMDTVRVSLQGATLGTVTMRDDALVPRDLPQSAELIAARAELARIEDEIAALELRKQTLLLPVDASDAIATFLSGLGSRDGDASLDDLRQIARMIGEETQSARRAALDAQAEAGRLDREFKALGDALEKARQTVVALERGEKPYLGLSASIIATEAGTAVLTLDYVIDDAQWKPVYDVHLTRGDTPSLLLKRGAYVMQETGEDWGGVTLLLSTARPLSQTTPSVLYPYLRRIEEPRPPIAYLERKMTGAAMDEPMVEPMVVAAAPVVSQLDGISVTYGYPGAVDIASGAEMLRLALGEVSLTPEVYARAIPQLDETAFVIAETNNTSGEIILPTDAAFFYLDGQFTGTHGTKLIAAGADATFSFGAVEGLRLTDTVLNRNEGDRGVISKSNEFSEAREFTIENLTGASWDLRLEGRVPYSEQEDLVIDWRARPQPQVTDPDGRRGILEWRLTMAPQSSSKVQLEHTITWPDGMELH